MNAKTWVGWAVCLFCGLPVPSAIAATLTLSVLDHDTDGPVAARVYLTDAAGNSHDFTPATEEGSAVVYDKQNRVNPKSIERHTTVSAHPCQAKVPPGRYRLSVHRGHEYHPHQQSVEVTNQDQRIEVRLRRWTDPNADGWYSADTHIHRNVDELRNVMLAENLNVAFPLTYWVSRSGRTPPLGPGIDGAPEGRLIRIDDRHVIWPMNTEYELFHVGQRQHTLGAIFALGHERPLTLGVPPWRPAIEAARQSGDRVLFDMDKLNWPFAMTLPTLAPESLYELLNNHVWRAPFAYREWYTPMPPYLQPPFGGTSGGHRQWVDATLGTYYTLLNAGLRMPPSAGTANGVHPVPAGFSRVYVHLPGGFDYQEFIDGLAAGRSFVTNGPVLTASAEGRDPGHVFTDHQVDRPLSITLEVASRGKLSYGEVIFNGQPVQLLRPQNHPSERNDFRTSIQTALEVNESGWFAIRFWQPEDDGPSRLVHSAPWYVEVDDQPVRIREVEKRYLVRRMRDELDRSRDVVSEAAVAEYQRALSFYESLPVRDDTEVVARQARPTTGDRQRHWLDNMIIAHRFTADEVRRATGMTLDQADQEIRVRNDQIAAVSPSQGVRLLPYPGGRHPRRGFLEGAIDPQRETKVSVFAPWKNGGYVVVDMPEAIFSDLGLTYLAHQHIPTIWDKEGIGLPKREWSRDDDRLTVRRELPNGIVFTSQAIKVEQGVRMSIQLHNGTEETLSDMRVQVCTMLKGTIGFTTQEPREHRIDGPCIAVRSDRSAEGSLDTQGRSDRWVLTGWAPHHRSWTNPPVPCIHSDPHFPDADPGETVSVKGELWFYEGDDIAQPLAEMRKRLSK